MKVKATASVLVTIWAGASAQDYNSAPPNLAGLPRIIYIGDPCAHYNDPETGLFHVGFLHNGTGIASVLTGDLVHYYDVRPNGNYSIVAGGPNDPLAVFDGSVIPNGVDGKPTLFHLRRGKNFTKLEIPPVISEPPAGLDVTAFRDPYVFQNGELDRSLNNAEGTWYTIISGGIHEVGPGMFLYQNISPNFEQWEYLGEWFHEPANSTWGNGDWSRIFGFNWETSNVFGLTKDGYSYNGEPFMTIAVESSYDPIQESVSSQHAQIWAAGAIATTEGENVTFTPDMVGVFDWGLASYAAAGKVLPQSSQASTASGAPDRLISYVWLTGDVFGGIVGFPAEQQGWQNTLLTSRELYIKDIPNVVDNDLVQETGSWRVVANSDLTGECVELETLGIEIARETYAAMTAAPSFTEPDRTTTSEGVIPFGRSPESRFFILEAEINFDARASSLQAGFQILASEFESTTIYYQFSNESIMIDRSQTSAAGSTTTGIDASPESGRIRLFDISDNCGTHGNRKDEEFEHDLTSNHVWGSDDHTSTSNGAGSEHIETLSLTIVVDNSVLEVYANSRFVLSTWVRPWYKDSTEIRFFQNGEGEASYSNIRVADGLYDAYPDRPQ
ncbi:Concanavalin A-like lectin/glucanases superfamily [Penicillium fimorum]|uniref:Concanavalin A-like lectin/glucanases superfamily n=1 Tax=Penicillium fimorum TaxID=1882269 RepID=A0A9W9XZA4_9EURO|nr:Concanavalin A-like lectin/glucanases superfamily [Penicillium fimorum]